jgi:hypothetical protein
MEEDRITFGFPDEDVSCPQALLTKSEMPILTVDA